MGFDEDDVLVGQPHGVREKRARAQDAEPIEMGDRGETVALADGLRLARRLRRVDEERHAMAVGERPRALQVVG